MKTAAIIAEYNPFHNGHLYQIQEIRRRSGADMIVVVMSGDFVQRGEPAVFDKYLRTEAAIRCGADLVLELPLPFATGSAARFASGAVSVIDALGMVDELWFGSECGEIRPFDQTAQILLAEPDVYRQALQKHLKAGCSFPAARSRAIDESGLLPESLFAGENVPEAQDDPVQSFLSSPNNILGLEYVLALKRLGSKVIPMTIKRNGSGYNETEISGTFSSATAIRTCLARTSEGPAAILDCVPGEVRSLYRKAWEEGACVEADDFSPQLLYQLWRETQESLCGYLDLSEELANRILNCREQFESFSSFAELLRTKNQTLSSMKRALLHILLNIRQEDVQSCPPMVRMLGMSRAAQKASVPGLISRYGTIAVSANPGTSPLGYTYEKDLFSSSLYQSVRCFHSGGKLPVRAEYRRKLIVL